MKTLYIDTTSNQEIIVGIFLDDKRYLMTEKLDFHKAQVVLPMIQNVVNQHHLHISDIERIEINNGPGSFTGVRVGVSVANALGFALGIPVNKKPFIEPVYSS